MEEKKQKLKQMHSTIKWGIISTGHISNKFAKALAILPEAELVAVASRNLASAKEFRNKYRLSTLYLFTGLL